MQRPQPGTFPRRMKSKTHKTATFKMDDDDETELSREDLKDVSAELQAISNKLREENRLLCEREAKLKEREKMLAVSQESLQTVTDYQMKLKIAAVEEKYQSELTQLEQALKEKIKENKRLKDNFETIRQANDVLKKENEILLHENFKLNKMSNSLQSRMNNLQRRQEYEQKLKDSEVLQQQAATEQVVRETGSSSRQEDKQDEKTLKATKSMKQTASQLYTTSLSILLEWVCDAFLRQSLTDASVKHSSSFLTPSFLHDKVFKVLPSLVDILRENGRNIRCCLPCMQFIYWSSLHIDQIQTQQNISMSTTLRRIGEEIYYPRAAKITEAEKIQGSSEVVTNKLKDSEFLKSSNSHVRLLSALIILKTLTQADVLANAFDVLKIELKSDHQKELFLSYQATSVVVTYMKPSNKAFVSTALDILLQLSAESPHQQLFLESCSNENFFRAAALLLRSAVPDVRVMEKLSIILQKLSKLKSNRRLFEMYTIASIIQELMLTEGGHQAFLMLNMKSILFNLNSAVKI